ncbi:MAG: low temperature requirement protein A [Solirubrobacteraceae bacterium]|nr:low temperature requirement protein A [Solirubrobacteraceae bacterium]
MSGTAARIAPVLRDDTARVTPLELFFDLVFVLALTQCTALMAHEPTWEGLAKGLLVLALLWWAWVGYAWMTSVVDPEEGAVRFVMFAAMAALLVVALCVPEAFSERALLFAVAYAGVRAAQVVLLYLGGREDPKMRAAVKGLAVTSAIGSALIIGASFLDHELQGAIWLIALTIDIGGPLLYGQDGWHISAGHFAERHGLILIIALGESIVAIGVGAEGIEIGAGEVTAAVLGMAIAAALWWLYFDVVALVAERRLVNAAPGREQNTIARDSFSYLHLPMIAGIVLSALGLKKTLGHVDDALKIEIATALFGGIAMYLLAHVAFRWRNVGRFSTQRLVVALVLLALIAVGTEVDALVSIGIVAAVLWALIAYETWRFADLRDRLRHEHHHPA